jgi:hypothetical protein
MKGSHFDDLSINEKAVLLYSYGSCLLAIEDQFRRFYLLSLDNDYVELEYNKFRKEIVRIELLDFNDLDKYLSHIHVCLNFTY